MNLSNTLTDHTGTLHTSVTVYFLLTDTDADHTGTLHTSVTVYFLLTDTDADHTDSLHTSVTVYFLLTDTDTTLNGDRVGANPKLENNCQISHKSSSRTGTEENLGVEMKANSDVSADDRTGKEETRFVWTRL